MPKGQELAQPSPEMAEAIATNASLFSEAMAKMSGEELPLGRAGVAFLDGFIERQRLEGDEAYRSKLADMAGCYLGSALIAVTGCRWVFNVRGSLCIELGPDVLAYPLDKAAKQFMNGSDDSVLFFFETVVALAAGLRSGISP